jgi:hypothetical protein
MRTVVSYPGGVVIQDHGVITWVGRDGSTSRPVGQIWLSAADADYAWLVDGKTPNYETPGMGPAFEQPYDDSGCLVALSPDGARHEVRTAQPVHGVTLDGDELVIEFAEEPIAHARGWGYSIEYPTSELRVARSEVLTVGIVGAPVRNPSPPAEELDRFLRHAGDSRWAWIAKTVDVVLRHGERAGDLIWWVGADPDADKVRRKVLVRGYEPDTGALILDIDAGEGLVVTARAVGEEFWIAIARQRLLAVPHSKGGEVIAVTSEGAVRTVHSPDSLDISVTDPPLVARPHDTEIQDQVAQVHAQFANLENYWQDQNGTTSPLSGGLSEPSVTVQGEWPETIVVVNLRHPARPGLILRRTFPVFDNRGLGLSQDNAVIELMEDLDTGYLAPPDEAIDGVLDT